MKKLAIRGNAARAHEIIELLRQLNTSAPPIHLNGCTGSNPRMVYILDRGIVREEPYSKSTVNSDLHIFELKRLLSKYPYRVGDLIKILWGNEGPIVDVKWDSDKDTIDYQMENQKWYRSEDIYLVGE